MRALEFLLAFFLLLAILVLYQDVPGVKYIFMIASFCLAVLYFISGIGISKNSFIHRLRMSSREEGPAIILRATGGLIFSLCTITILFNELYYPTRTVLLHISVVLLTLLMFLDIYFLEKNDRALFRFIIIRSAIFSAVLIYYLLIPIQTRLEWKYDDQYYIEILHYAIDNPYDAEAQKTVKDYESRMRGEINLESPEE